MKRIITSIFLLFAATLGVLAQQHTTSFDVEGVKVIFKPTIKDVISVRVFFRGGVADYSADKAGLAQLAIGATAECGTKKYDANRFRDVADQYGVEIGGSADYDFDDINMICVSKYFNQGWDLLTEAVMNPVFDETEVQLLKNKLVAGIKQEETDPDARISQLVIQNAFKGTVYATDPKGTEATVNPLTTQALKDYYHEMLNKNRMFIVVAGRISQDELIAKIKASFAGLPSRPYTPIQYQAPVLDDYKVLAENKSIATNYVSAVTNAPVMSSPDYVPFHMGMSALSGTLFSEIRTKRNLSYSPAAYAVNEQMPYAIMSVSTPSPKECIEIMVSELNRLKSVGITSSGLKELKSSYITASYTKAQESNAMTNQLGLAEIMGDWKLFDTAADRIEEVTGDQILKAINKYIVGLRWSYLGDINLANGAAGAFKLQVH